MVLEVSAVNAKGEVLWKEAKEYKNVGLSKKGEAASAAWLISSYSTEKSTAFRPLEVKKESFTLSLQGNSEKVQIHARIYSHHGLPVEFGKPAEGQLVLQATQEVDF